MGRKVEAHLGGRVWGLGGESWAETVNGYCGGSGHWVSRAGCVGRGGMTEKEHWHLLTFGVGCRVGTGEEGQKARLQSLHFVWAEWRGIT